MSKDALEQIAVPLRTIEYAAQRLGMRPAGVRAKIYRREIPYHKIGRLVRISDDVIERLIAEGTVPARKRA